MTTHVSGGALFILGSEMNTPKYPSASACGSADAPAVTTRQLELLLLHPDASSRLTAFHSLRRSITCPTCRRAFALTMAQTLGWGRQSSNTGSDQHRQLGSDPGQIPPRP